MTEILDPQPAFAVADAEYLRLLGYPRGHEPGDRPRELMVWARDWYARHGRPWVCRRAADLAIGPDSLTLGGADFRSRRLAQHLRDHAAVSAVLLAVSAGPECEEHARQLWAEGKPDEYFFLEMYGSAVVEDLVARSSGRICDEAAPRGLMAVPHYSPGYTGWDVAEQTKLFDVITQGRAQPFPGPLEVLTSGMLRPKKSLLGVFGLAPQRAGAATATPCENCAFSPCAYRRGAYRHQTAGTTERPAPVAPETAAATPLTRDARYTTGTKALRKWAAERVNLVTGADGSVQATFRFDGTTCSNMGQPLAFDYRITLSRPDDGYRILAADCGPAAGDTGYQSTCAYQANPDAFLQAIAGERPLLGRRLDDILTWSRTPAPSGCHCAAESRKHKWGLAYEAVHFALVQAREPQPVS